MLTGQTFSPTSPFLASLYHQVYPNREDVFPAALAFAREQASCTSMPAIAFTKALLWHGMDNPEEQHLLDSMVFKSLMLEKDGKEGAKAFLEKRAPSFKASLSEDLPVWMPWVGALLVNFFEFISNT